MRESIGTVSLLNFVMFFILLIFAFLMGTFSYYKAYKVNNAMVAAIEKYEGFNELSYKEIEQKLSNYGYNKVNFKCPNKKDDDGLIKLLGIDDDGKNVHPEDDRTKLGYSGYCIYVYDLDTEGNKTNDVYASYEVTTVITFQFPIVQNILKMKVSSKTTRIYDFEASDPENTNIGKENCYYVDGKEFKCINGGS